MPALLLTVVLLLYPLAVHLLIVAGAAHAAVLGLIVVCLVNLALLRAGRRLSPAWLAMFALLAVAGLLNVFTGTVYALFLPPLLVNVALMLLFWNTLRPGKIPLIERLMRLEYGAEPAEPLRRYARQATWSWALFFAAVAAASLVLAATAPLEAWSFFVNVLNYLLVAALFVAQQAYRLVRFRRFGLAMPWQMVRRLARMPLTDPAHPLSGGPAR